MSLAKLGLAIFLGLIFAEFAAWHFTQPSSSIPARVESQIQGFGKQLAQALAPKSRFRAIANGYLPQPEPSQVPAGLKPQEAQALAQMHSGDAALVLTFPEYYSGGTQVRSQGMAVTLKPLGSRPVSAQIENGKLVYHNAYKATDSLNVVTDGRSEEFLLLHDTTAPQRFEYELSALSGVKEISLQDNAIHLKTAQGQQLQIEAPWLIETGGQKVANAVRWELSHPNGQTQSRLALVVTNAKQLHYPVVIDPTWVVTNGGLNTARFANTATLLNNGQVLVAGGFNSGVLTSCELYNPATGIWTITGSLTTARYVHTATLLPNGQVLVAGGESEANTFLTSAELYDPASGTWTATGDLNTGRSNHTATLLPNGRVLIAGGYTSPSTSTVTTSAELYDPANGTWTVTGSLNTARTHHTATLLSNGLVLAAGGGNGLGYVAIAELYNPANGSWTTTGSLNIGRESHTATLLNSGQVLVTGGASSSQMALDSAELYNPATGLWTATGSMTTTRTTHSATLLPDGFVLVAGGGNGSSIIGSVELYNPISGSFSATTSLRVARGNQTATLLPSGQVLIAAGSGSSGILGSSELYNPDGGTFSVTGNLNSNRVAHTATLLPNGQVLVAGGLSSGHYSASAELYNSANRIWTVTGSLNTARVNHTATLLPNGQVLVAGGEGTSAEIPLTSAELYDPTNGTWTETGNLNIARESHTATLLPNGQVLVAGGYGGMGVGSMASAELYNPANGTWTATGRLNNARYTHTATLLPNGQVLVAGADATGAGAELYNPASGTWAATDSLNLARWGQTATLLPNGQVLVAGGTGNSGDGITSAELYNPAKSAWTVTGSLNTARLSHTATLLLNGQVLVAGGYYYNNGSVYLSSAELYNPANGTWTATGSLNTARKEHTATLLPSGQVVVAGGDGSSGYFASTELYNLSLGYTSATQPQLNAVSSASSTAPLSLTGTNFSGVSEASGGATNNSSSNIPVVQLRSLVNEEVIDVPLDPNQGFRSTSFTSLSPTGFVPGYALLTMFVNGTPSLSQIVSYSLAAQTIANFPATQTVTLSSSPITLPATTSAGLTITYSVPSGPASISGNALTLTGAGTVVLQANQGGNDIYAPLSVIQTLTVDQTFAQWKEQYPTLTDTVATGTPEMDGVPTLLKYLYNINPAQSMNANDRAALPVIGVANNGDFTFTYGHYAYYTGITINVQTSTDLITWTTLSSNQYTQMPTGGNDPNGDPYTKIEIPFTNARTFIRLNVTMP